MIRNRQILISLLLLTIGGISCARKPGNAEVVFPTTEVGTPQGPSITREIGPAGGSIASLDGRLTLTVPQNALTETVTFSIQPITNKAEGGLGLGYRLGPDGKTFSTPLEVSVRYEDHDLAGTVAEALVLAYQDGQGAWHAQKSAKLDQTARTLTISTTHFTDFTLGTRFRLSPTEATLHIGKEQLVHLIECKEPGFFDKLFSRPLDCSPVLKGREFWSLRGPGRFSLEQARGALYVAPDKKPTPNVAWLDVHVRLYLWNQDTGETSQIDKTFSAKITIVDSGYRASGKIFDTVLSGDICDLEKPFIIKTSNPYNSSLECVPSSPTTGTCSVSEKNGISGGGGGPYTVTGTETLKTGIELTFGGKATIKGAGTGTGGGPIHIDLTPLDTECKP